MRGRYFPEKKHERKGRISEKIKSINAKGAKVRKGKNKIIKKSNDTKDTEDTKEKL